MPREAEFSQGENEIKDAPEGQKELHDYIKQNKEIIHEHDLYTESYDYGDGNISGRSDYNFVDLANKVWWGNEEKGKDPADIKLRFFDSKSNLAETKLIPEQIPICEKISKEQKLSLTPPTEKQHFWSSQDSARRKWARQWQKALQPIINSQGAEFPKSKYDNSNVQQVEFLYNRYRLFLQRRAEKEKQKEK